MSLDYRQKYWTGLTEHVIFSTGLGSMFLPIRFFALPKIVVINYI
jgi:predicted MPP superfamily phosphohydrolase